MDTHCVFIASDETILNFGFQTVILIVSTKPSRLPTLVCH